MVNGTCEDLHCPSLNEQKMTGLLSKEFSAGKLNNNKNKRQKTCQKSKIERVYNLQKKGKLFFLQSKNISSFAINRKWDAIADSQVKKRTTIPSALCERRYECAGHSQTVVRLQLVKGSYIITPCVKFVAADMYNSHFYKVSTIELQNKKKE